MVLFKPECERLSKTPVAHSQVVFQFCFTTSCQSTHRQLLKSLRPEEPCGKAGLLHDPIAPRMLGRFFFQPTALGTLHGNTLILKKYRTFLTARPKLRVSVCSRTLALARSAVFVVNMAQLEATESSSLCGTHRCNLCCIALCTLRNLNHQGGRVALGW